MKSRALGWSTWTRLGLASTVLGALRLRLPEYLGSSNINISRRSYTPTQPQARPHAHARPTATTRPRPRRTRRANGQATPPTRPALRHARRDRTPLPTPPPGPAASSSVAAQRSAIARVARAPMLRAGVHGTAPAPSRSALHTTRSAQAVPSARCVRAPASLPKCHCHSNALAAQGARHIRKEKWPAPLPLRDRNLGPRSHLCAPGSETPLSLKLN